MNLQTILNVVNTYIDKEISGNNLAPEDYNSLLESTNLKLYDQEYKKIEIMAKTQNAILHTLMSSAGTLRPFKKKETKTGFSGGILVLSALSATLRYPLVCMAKYNGIWRKVSILTDEQMVNRKVGVLSNLNVHPAMCIYDTFIEFSPNAINNIELTYLKVPATPYYDYCISNSTGEIYYMPVGYYVKYELAGTYKWNLYNGSGVLQYSDVYYRDAPLVPAKNQKVYSDTVELEWLSTEHMRFVYMILEAYGIRLREGDIAQYADKEEKETV